MDDESQNTINHRVVVSRRGGPEMLLVIEEDLPEPAPDEVRIRVEAAGVSGYDLTVRAHRFPGAAKPPFTLGEDVVGTVDKVGDSVSSVEPDQRVAAWTFGDARAARARWILRQGGANHQADRADELAQRHAGAHLGALSGCSEPEPPGELA